MKEILRFISWGWTNFQTWQKMFIFAMLLQIVGWSIGGNLGFWLANTGMIIVFGYLMKWFVIDAVKDSWGKYKEQRNKLLTDIKNSDN